MDYAYAIHRRNTSGNQIRPKAPDGALPFIEDSNLFSGFKDALRHFGSLTFLESDLLTIASAVFAADRASKRGEREDISRSIHLYIPVYCIEKITQIIPTLRKILRDLSQDNWFLTLTSINKDGKEKFTEEDELQNTSQNGRALLFSGGLDSLAAAVEFGKEPLLLVSHLTKNNVTRRAQDELFELLIQNGYVTNHHQYFVSSQDANGIAIEHAIETSQRTRSFVFLTIGTIAARRAGLKELILMAENGQMAIHLPLTSGRIGAFSTHTAHPSVLAGAEKYFSSILNTTIKIHNPYVYKTKAEVVSEVIKNLPSAIKLSTSCWKNTRVSQSGTTHCGECIPCYLRRISIEIWQPDPTPYARDIWHENLQQLSDDDYGRRNLIDLLEFISWFKTKPNEDLMCEFPELFSDDFDANSAIDMYKRFANEALKIFSNYPNVATLLN